MGLRDGKIVLHRPFTHRADALEAAGFANGDQLRNAIELIGSGMDAWNRHDIDRVSQEGLREFFNASTDVWEEFIFTPIAYVPKGDAVVVELDVKGTARGSGIVIEEQWAHVYRQRDGRLVRFHAFRSPEEAYAALSYPEPQ